MPRCTRKQLVLENEEQAREDRQEGYRRLLAELRRSWQKRERTARFQ